MVMDLNERLQKERVEGRILKRKQKLVFLRLPKWKFLTVIIGWILQDLGTLL